MSIRLMSQVYDCKVTHAEQSVLLAMADHARDDGTKCFPSVPLLAWKTGYSERQIQRIMAILRSKGALVLASRATQHRSAEYRIDLLALPSKPPFRGDILSSDQNARGDTGDVPGVTPLSPRGDIAMSPEPLEPSREPLTDTDAIASGLPASRITPPALLGEPTVNGNGASQGVMEPDGTHVPDAPREDRAVFGELAAWMGFDLARLPGNVRGRLNKTGAALRAAGFTADDVATARLRWPESHWKGIKGQAPAWADIEEFMAQAAVMPSTRGLNADAIF